MKKPAQDIKPGDTVKGWAYWMTVEKVAKKMQKNGTPVYHVEGRRIFKNAKEENAIANYHGDKAYDVYDNFRHNTKVTCR